MTKVGVDIVDIESLRRLCSRSPSFWNATMGLDKSHSSINDFTLLAKKISEAEAAFKATSVFAYLADIRLKEDGSNSFSYNWETSKYFLQFSNARSNQLYISICLARKRFVLSRLLICLQQFWSKSRTNFRKSN